MDREELLRAFPAHRGRLVASLARLVGPADAEDLAEETLLRAFGAVDGFRGDAALGTWLHRIGTNLALDLLRRRKADPVLPAEPGVEVPEAVTEASASDGLERRQMSDCVRDLLAQLPPSQRDVLVQADVLDYSGPEIARTAGISPGNAKIRLHRARRALQAALETHCEFHRREPGVLCCTPKAVEARVDE